jgi:hypothetical protein
VNKAAGCFIIYYYRVGSRIATPLTAMESIAEIDTYRQPRSWDKGVRFVPERPSDIARKGGCPIVERGRGFCVLE